jgi:transcriptional regulator with XRE-family HTH domain
MEELQTIIERLKDRRLYKVSEKTGLSYQGLRNLVTGRTSNPSIKTIEKLREYLNECK